LDGPPPVPSVAGPDRTRQLCLQRRQAPVLRRSGSIFLPPFVDDARSSKSSTSLGSKMWKVFILARPRSFILRKPIGQPRVGKPLMPLRGRDRQDDSYLANDGQASDTFRRACHHCCRMNLRQIDPRALQKISRRSGAIRPKGRQAPRNSSISAISNRISGVMRSLDRSRPGDRTKPSERISAQEGYIEHWETPTGQR
jgi:hypothetical protein